jgi:hypothetical protein
MLLPAAERRGEIQFYVAKSLPYGWRLIVAFALMAAGLGLQAGFMPPDQRLERLFAHLGIMPALGLVLVLAGVVIVLTRGYANTLVAPSGTEAWRTARRAEVERILAINQKQRKWDHAVIDVTCGLGCFAFLVLACAAGVAASAIASFSTPAAAMFLANAAVMLIPFWITGVRSILKNDRLVIKARMLLEVEDNLFDKRGGEEFQYQMQTARTKDGEAPRDLKALVAFHEGPPEFLGLQMQVSINSVQGTDYPYFYCVLVARETFQAMGLAGQLDDAPSNVTVESKQDAGVTIAVIRQTTTANSGYHTKPNAVAAIFAYALEQARRLAARA